jgi:hypothetical protein
VSGALASSPSQHCHLLLAGVVANKVSPGLRWWWQSRRARSARRNNRQMSGASLQLDQRRRRAREYWPAPESKIESRNYLPAKNGEKKRSMAAGWVGGGQFRAVALAGPVRFAWLTREKLADNYWRLSFQMPLLSFWPLARLAVNQKCDRFGGQRGGSGMADEGGGD